MHEIKELLHRRRDLEKAICPLREELKSVDAALADFAVSGDAEQIRADIEAMKGHIKYMEDETDPFLEVGQYRSRISKGRFLVFLREELRILETALEELTSGAYD